MREESVVVASRTTRAHGDATHSAQPSMVRDDGAEIDGRWNLHRAASEARVDLRAHFVAATADRRSEVHCELGAWNPTRGECVQRALDNARGRASPAGVQQRDRSRRMPDEHRHAVRKRDRHSGPALEREMAVAIVATQPSFPPGTVFDHMVAVDLMRRREPWPARCELSTTPVPSRHDVTNGFVASDSEATDGPHRGERANSDRVDLRDRLVPRIDEPIR